MKIVRFADNNGKERLGTNLVNGTAELIDGGLFDELKPSGQRAQVRTLLAPVSPINIFGVGLNYRAHAQETGVEIPKQPVIFMKPTTAVANPEEPILIPKCCSHGPEVDYECELAVVIGRTARDVPESEALQYILGYTAANDVSARRWQKHSPGGQWIRGKGFDRFCPLGPALVTSDEISDPQVLAISTTLNGEIMQQSNTADMIFSVATLISYISRDTMLLPGTVILTGTPPGVGFVRKPPVFLKPGDEVHIEVEKIGKLSNRVEAG